MKGPAVTELDYKAFSFWLDLAQWIFLGILAVWGYLRTKATDNARALALLSKTLADFIARSGEAGEQQNMRLTRLEEKMEHIPTDGEFAHLAGDVATVKAQVDGLTSLLERVEHQTQMIHQHLLKR